MQQAWRAGDRRVSLFCADELRPAACCVVDALFTRGYDVTLSSGAEAREALRAAGSAEVLRVVWAPDTGDAATRARLRGMLDPDAAGDVMILASSTPRGVIEAIEAFGAPRRKRLRAGPRKTYLAQPTLMERKLDARGWVGSALGATAIAALFGGGIWASASGEPGVTTAKGAAAPVETMTAPARRSEEPLLAATREPLVVDEADDVDDSEVIVVEDPTPTRTIDTRAVPEDAPSMGVAPLEDSAPRTTSTPPFASVLPDGMPMGGSAMQATARPRAIDPF